MFHVNLERFHAAVSTAPAMPPEDPAPILYGHANAVWIALLGGSPLGAVDGYTVPVVAIPSALPRPRLVERLGSVHTSVLGPTVCVGQLPSLGALGIEVTVGPVVRQAHALTRARPAVSASARERLMAHRTCSRIRGQSFLPSGTSAESLLAKLTA